jgi:hypothetical protein
VEVVMKNYIYKYIITIFLFLSWNCKDFTPTSEKSCQNGKALILASLAYAENSENPKEKLTFADAFILERLSCEERFKE